MSKVQSKRSTKNKESEGSSPKGLIILTIIYGGVLMYLYGMSRIYFPDPVHIGFGQYFDVGIGILFFGLALYGIIIGVLLKKIKKRK